MEFHDNLYYLTLLGEALTMFPSLQPYRKDISTWLVTIWVNYVMIFPIAIDVFIGLLLCQPCFPISCILQCFWHVLSRLTPKLMDPYRSMCEYFYHRAYKITLYDLVIWQDLNMYGVRRAFWFPISYLQGFMLPCTSKHICHPHIWQIALWSLIIWYWN